MKKRYQLLFAGMLSAVCIPACTAKKEETSVSKSSDSQTISESNTLPSSETKSPSSPVASKRIVPAIPLTKMVPMKTGQNDLSEKVSTLQESAEAPDFASTDLAGKLVQLSDFKNKVLVLDFWATWCGPCLASLPHTQEVANRYKDQDVVVLAVCTGDTREKFESWVAENQTKYPDVIFTCDPNERGSATYDDRASRKLFGVKGIPTQFVIGRDNKISAVLVGNQKDDLRLEAGLARTGVQVDSTIAEQGETQIKNAPR